MKLCDFGISKKIGDTCLSEGTVPFMSPEHFLHDDARKLLRPVNTEKADVYSFGITLFFLVFNYNLLGNDELSNLWS